ncbi:hypothetical protein CHS0354_007487 [Potamilus streckersoni]|uniref:Uncharacterized protein n=1 Tax=Potamilus streckersoni TaxID=2493646 RepID=A0AAE0T7T3_9BIVA|nr:hypothetical protein CHS0354_007487 [Potamilus streckersoni]
MTPTKKAATASQMSAKTNRPLRSKIQEETKKPRKKAALSTSSAKKGLGWIHIVSDGSTTQVTLEIHNKFDQQVAMLGPSTENCPLTLFQIGTSIATNTPVASMVSPAIVEP